MQKTDTLIFFAQYGYREDHESGGQSVGNCPLCGKQKHFFISLTSVNKAWDCKSCGQSGGYQKFLQAAIEVANDKKHFLRVQHLAETRGLDYETLKALRVGYFPEADTWLIPVYGADGKTLLNVKIYDGSSFKNTAGCSAAIYNMNNIPKSYDTVYVAEGEWDAMALIEMLSKVQATRSAVLGVPGAGTFKAAALPLFIGKRVYLLYDNDLAGRNGIKKALEILNPVAAELWPIKWPENTPEKYDVRDVYTKKFISEADPALCYLEENCNLHEGTANGSAAVLSGVAADPVPVQQVYDVYNKWLHLPNTDLIDVVYGTVLANRLDGDPVWLFLVAPPGATKTELLMSLSGGSRIESISTLTPHTLISGANFGGNDPSLIPQLNGKSLVIKDFTAVLGMPSQERDEIFSILRDAYDGECSKPFGNGITRRYKSRFGILAGVTPAIEQFTGDHAALGERFLRYHNTLSNDYGIREKFIRRALSNVTKEQEMRAEISGVAKQVLLATYTKIPTVSDAYQDTVINQAQWISVLRATVNRDRFTKDIIYRPYIELSTRVSKEVYKLLMGIALFKGRDAVNADDMKLAAGVARSSIDSRYLDVIKFMFKNPKDFTTAELKDTTGLPTSTTEMVLGNLAMLATITKKIESGKAWWAIRPEFAALTKAAKVFN